MYIDVHGRIITRLSLCTFMKKLIRIPKRTIFKMDEINQIEDPYLAVCAYVDLVEHYVTTEKGHPVKYHEENGQPKEWEWQPHQKFKQKVKQQGFLFHNEVIVYLREIDGKKGQTGKTLNIIHPKVLEYFKEKISESCPLMVHIDSKPYVIALDAIAYSSYQHHYGARSGIVIHPLGNELSLEGIVRFS